LSYPLKLGALCQFSFLPLIIPLKSGST
jgi:hypothetical protein